MQDLFTNTFSLGRKIKLSVAGLSENGRKKMISRTRKSISASRNMENLFKNAFPLDEKTAYIGRNI